MKQETIDAVRKLTYERVESAVKLGRAIRKNSWFDINFGDKGQCCAVGAIAFNGDVVTEDCLVSGTARTDRTYALASKQLLDIGVTKLEVGLVLDAISAGFEDVYRESIIMYSELKGEDDAGLRHDELPKEYRTFHELGREIREKYVK